MKLLSSKKKNDDGTPSYAKIHVIISICDDVKTFKYMCHNEVFFLFLWKFVQMWKNKYVKRIFYHFFSFLEKKLLDLQKLENHFCDISLLILIW
jgi:hypothetical protein